MSCYSLKFLKELNTTKEKEQKEKEVVEKARED
jgi:hypothetical protein